MNILKRIIRRLSREVRGLYQRTKIGYWDRAKEYYYRETGMKLDYNHPKDLNEKLMWLERYWQHPLKTICADKYLVREYIKKHGMADMLVPLIAVYDSVEEIDFNVLPKQFVLKCNHGSAYNIICHDKSKLDLAEVKSKLSKWMAEDFSELFTEIHYRDIPHKIICEELISTTAPIEYQLWCINGKAQSFLVCRKNLDGSYDAWSYSLDWQPLNDRIYESKGCPPKPSDISHMIRCAELLAEPFPFLRADFYEADGKIYFAEMTFSPSTNILSKYNDDFLRRYGDMLQLPRWKWPETNFRTYRRNVTYIDKFVEEMNKEAAELGMKSIHFDDPSGLSYLNEGNVYDVAKLLHAAIQIPSLVRYMNIQEIPIHIMHRGLKPKKLILRNTFPLDDIKDEVDEITAVKTGSDGYIFNVAIAFKSKGESYIVVILNADSAERRTECFKAIVKLIKDSTKPELRETESVYVGKLCKANQLEPIFVINGDQSVPLLSITKVISCMLVIKNIKKLPPIIRIKDCDEQRGAGTFLKRNTILTSKAAIYSALVASSNTGIYALGRNVGQSL